MTLECPLDSWTLVAYWADDLDTAAAEAVEDHVMECERCAEASGRIAEITEALRQVPPPVLSHARVARLRERGAIIQDNPIAPGEINTGRVTPELDILLHRLGGLDLVVGSHVTLRIAVERGDAPLFAIEEVPFDSGTGELLVACHRHFAALPPDVTFTVDVRHPSGHNQRNRYTVRHLFPGVTDD